MMPYCTSYFKFLSAWFWGFPEQNKDSAITTYGETAGIILWALLTIFLVCLFVLGLSSHSNFFQSYGDVTHTGEGLQNLTYARHLWPLNSEGSLACHTYCDTGHPFIMVISKDLNFTSLFTKCAVIRSRMGDTVFFFNHQQSHEAKWMWI